MKIQEQRQILLQACQLVQQAVPTRSTKPILSSVKAVAADNKLTLVATDLEIGLRYTLPGVHIDEPGEAMLPIAKLRSILQETPDASIRIDADDKRCIVTAAYSEFETTSESPDSFPDVPGPGDEDAHELPVTVLRQMIRKTQFAAARQDTKYAITGVCFEFSKGGLKIVATDTRRLAMHDGKTTATGATIAKPVIVPAKALAILDRCLGDDHGSVQIWPSETGIIFQSRQTVMHSRLLEGRFPPYKDIILKKTPIKVNLPVGAFLSSLRQAAIMTDDVTKRVEFAFKAGKLTMQASGSTVGKSRVEMPVEGQDDVKINFDPVYLIDMLKVLDGAEGVVLEMVDGVKPAILRAGEDYLYLVMPLT